MENVKCIVAGKGRTCCSGAIRFVGLVKNETESKQKGKGSSVKSILNSGEDMMWGSYFSEFPKEVRLCQRHHQDLKEKGIMNFFQKYGLNKGSVWEDELPDDRHMTYLDPGILEGVANARKPKEASGGYGCVPGYESLRQTNIVLEEMSLTDKQLVAVCLVFYGGIKKKHAARAMKISAQALSDHIKAALKKIKGGIGYSL